MNSGTITLFPPWALRLWKLFAFKFPRHFMTSLIKPRPPWGWSQSNMCNQNIEQELATFGVSISHFLPFIVALSAPKLYRNVAGYRHHIVITTTWRWSWDFHSRRTKREGDPPCLALFVVALLHTHTHILNQWLNEGESKICQTSFRVIVLLTI